MAMKANAISQRTGRSDRELVLISQFFQLLSYSTLKQSINFN